jgi:hypothetical protein
LLEVVISTVILLTVVVGFSYGLVSSTSLERATREHTVAREAARGCLETLRATEFSSVLATYAGTGFDVPGLDPRPDDADGQVGEIIFPLDEDGELHEDLELPRLGMPRDLTGEGDLDEFDHAFDYRVLPVLVRLEWRGAAGDGAFEVLTILKRMRP